MTELMSPALLIALQWILPSVVIGLVLRLLYGMFASQAKTKTK